MYKTIHQAVDFVQSFKPLVVTATHSDIFIAPSFTAIKSVAEKLAGSNISVGSQDIADHTEMGAYTGEVSAEMLKDAGASYAIIGHSERRQYYFETNELVNRKVRAAVAAKLLPVFCVGESLEQRDSGMAEEVVARQLSEGLKNLTLEEVSLIITAYEPVWAIGTGRTATPQTAEQMHSFIRSRVRELFGDKTAEGMRILYGGSVKPDNIASLMNETNIDGALVGGASLEPESFAKIVNYR